MTETEPALPGRRTRTNILLIVSLCANVALVAIVVMGLLSAARHAGVFANLSPQGLMADSSWDERARLRAVLDGHAARLKALRMTDLQARRALMQTLAASALDTSGFASALKSVRTADDALREEQEKVTVEFVSQLSPNERAAIAERVRRRAEWVRFLRGHFGAH